MREKYLDKLGLHRNENSMEIEGQDDPAPIINNSFSSSKNPSGVVSQVQIASPEKEAESKYQRRANMITEFDKNTKIEEVIAEHYD